MIKYQLLNILLKKQSEKEIKKVVSIESDSEIETSQNYLDCFTN